MPDVLLHFPFLDKRIGYNCATCRSGCCKTGFMGATTAEAAELVRIQPRLRSFFKSEPSPGKYSLYAKFKPSCWFLQDDGWCSIEKERGHAAKPYVCRAHPVYFRWFEDEGVCVTHYYRGCVWQLEDVENAIGAITYDGARALSREWLAAVAYVSQLDANAWRGTTLRAVLAMEDVIRDRSDGATDIMEHLAWQTALTRAFLAGEPLPDQAEAADREHVRASLQLMMTALDLDPLDEDFGAPDLCRTFLLSMPMLRLTILPSILRETGTLKDAREALLRLPGMLLALFLYGYEYTRVVAKGARRRPNHDTYIELIENWEPRLYGLSLLGATTVVDEDADAELAAADPEWTTALLMRVQDQPGRPLAEHFMAATEGASVERRLACMDDLVRARPFLTLTGS